MSPTYTRRWSLSLRSLGARHRWHVHELPNGESLAGDAPGPPRHRQRFRRLVGWLARRLEESRFSDHSTPELHRLVETSSLDLPDRVAALSELVARPDVDTARLWALRERAHELDPYIVLRLGEQGFDLAHHPLLSLLSSTDPWLSAQAAAILENDFADDAGLRRFAPELRSNEVTTFLRSWNLFRAVQPPYRDATYVELIGRALDSSGDADRLAGLLYLLLDVSARREVGPPAVPILLDDRPARIPILRRPVRLNRLAADCLLTNLYRSSPSRWSLPGSIQRRRRLRLVRSLRSATDWYRLYDRSNARG